VKGNLLPQDQAAVAIVGSRNATAEYMELAADLAYGLAQEGVTIVSGLARGIDRAAHQGALEAGGRTLAVLGSGVDIVYPPQHEELARRIEAQGAVLSFFPLGTPPSPRAISRLMEFVGIVSMFMLLAVSPSFITEPLPYCFSIWANADSKALILSSFAI